jgi:hypothetical protein
MRSIVIVPLALLGFLLFAGFSLDNPQVPVEDILPGGDSRRLPH